MPKTVTMDQADIEYLTSPGVGDGELSRGIRRAAQIMREKMPRAARYALRDTCFISTIQGKKKPSESNTMTLTKLAALSKIDRETLEFRGASGFFKPENSVEAVACKNALANGATHKLDWWLVEDYPKAIDFRATFAKCGVDLQAATS